jgi:hypothetical protein
VSDDGATRTFADIEGRTNTARRRCKLCGSSEPAGVVRIEARAYGTESETHPLKGGRTLASLSLSLCEQCVVERYEAVEHALTADKPTAEA